MMKGLFIFFSILFLPMFFLFAQTQEPSTYTGAYFGLKPPGEDPVVFAPGLISSDKMELMISFSGDGKLCTFNRSDGPGGNENKPGLYFMLQKEKGWTKPAPVPYLKKRADAYYILGPRGYLLYFASNRPLPGTTEKLKQRKLWKMELTERTWGKPQMVELLATTKNFVGHPSLTYDGTVYFYDESPKYGLKKADIFFSRYKDGKYGPREDPGRGINKDYDECDAFVDPGERFILYAVKENPKCLGDFDIFISYKLSDGAWSDGVSLGNKINSKEREIYPRVSPDGKYIFYGSNKSGNWDIYWCGAEIIKKLRPKEK